MKKIFSVLIVAFLISSLMAGCSGKKVEIVSVDTFKENISSIVELSNYVEGTREDGTQYYAYRGALLSEINLKYSLEIEKDTKINIPDGFVTLKNEGWTFKNKAYENLKLNHLSSSNAVCVKDGKEIMAFTKNVSEAPLKCSDCVVERIKFDIFTKEDNYAEKLSTAPDFKLGSIDDNSTMQEVIKAFGEPTEINYTVKDNNCTEVMILYQNTDSNDFIKILFTPDGKKIAGVDYCVVS